MAQTVAVDTKILSDILSTLKELKRELAEVKAKLEKAPPYGSSKWWEWSIKKGLQEAKEGKYETFDSVDEYIKAVGKRL